MKPLSRIPVSVLGATGVVGQRFVRRLARHPWFEILHLAASERSAGKRLREACEWRLRGEPHAGLGERLLVEAGPETALAPVVFSALDTQAARELEPAFAAAGAWVFSNAAAFRMEKDVPLLIPEVNPEHLSLIDRQRRERAWSGAIVCNPNCTAAVMVTALAPLEAAFGIEAVFLSSMQAASGAGYPGVPSLDLMGNVIPFIRDEEEKVAQETRKMFGRLDGEEVTLSAMRVSAACHRVPVADGHTEAISVKLRAPATTEEVRAALAGWAARSSTSSGLPRLPSAPGTVILLHEAENRPQARLDLDEDGMTVHVGRVRPCEVLDFKLTVLGHNAERGAAGASVLNAELARATGRL